VPVNHHPINLITLRQVNHQPLAAVISGPPASRAISVNSFQRTVGAAFRPGGRGNLVQGQIRRRRRRRAGTEAADIGRLGQLVSGQGHPVEGQMIPPFDVVAAYLGGIVAMAGGTDGQSGGDGSVGEVGDRIDLSDMFNLGQAKVNGITSASSSVTAGKLRDKQIKDSTAGTSATTAVTASIIVPRSTIAGLGVKGHGVVTSRASAIMLDRSALVVHIFAVTFAAGGLRRPIGGGRGNLVAMGAIAGLRPSGGVMRAILMAVGADTRIVGGGVADAAIPAHLSQRIGMVNLGNRRGMAGLAAAAVERDSAVAVGTIAGSELRLPMMIGRQAGIGSMTGGANDAADFGTDMASRTIPKRKEIGGMVGYRRPGQGHGAVMTAGAIQPFDIDPDMADGALAHLIGNGHVVLIDNRSLIAGGVAGRAIQSRRIDVGVTGTAGDAVTGGGEMMAFIHRRRTRAGMAPGAFDGGRLGAGVAVETAPADGEFGGVMHLRAAVLGQTVVASGTGQIGRDDRCMTGDTVVAVIHQIGRRGVMHRSLTVLGLGRVAGGAIESGGGDAGMAGAALHSIRGGGRVMALGQRHGVGVFVAAGAVDGGEGHAAVTGIAGLGGKGRMQVVHGRRAVPGLADMAGGAIEAAGDGVDPLVTGRALIVDGRGGGMMHDRCAVQYRLGGMAAFASTGGDGLLGAAMAGDAVVAAILAVKIGGVVHDSRAVLARQGVMATGAVEGHGPGMAEGAVVFDVGRRGVVHGRRAVVGPPCVAGGTIEAGLGDPFMTGRALIADGRSGGMMHFRRAVSDRLRPVAALTGTGHRGIGGAGVTLITSQPVPFGGGVVPFGDGHGVGAFMAAGAVDGRKGHAVMTGIAGLGGKGRMQVMHGDGAVPRLALMTGGAIEPAGDPLNPLMAGAALVV